MSKISIKQEKESNVVYTIDNNTQLEFISNVDRKTIIVIDKERFLVCKQLFLENAPDEEYAAFLNIPLDRVRYFKHKMQIFEDSIRARRRAARLNAQRKRKIKPVKRKREVSSEERFKKARELIGKNYSTNQISKILKISERSVTRFKKRIREEKRKLKAEGKIQANPDDPDDESSFKYLPNAEKIKRAKELFQKRLKIPEISAILKISERSVRRWKDRLDKMEYDEEEPTENLEIIETKQPEDESDDDDEDVRPKRKRRAYLDREKVEYAAELIENGLSNKEISMLLEMSIACVRKLKTKILNGSIEELIDDSEEHYKAIYKDDKNDPLKVLPEILMPSISPKTACERKPKVNLSDKDMYIVRLLRDNQIRTMDIAKLIGISERSVTRLLSKAKDLTKIEYDQEIVEEVERLLASKDEILNQVVVEEATNSTICDDSREKNLGLSLLAMNVKVKDVAKMLDLPEKLVQKWRTKIIKQEVKEEEVEYQDHADIKIQPKEEYIIEYIE